MRKTTIILVLTLIAIFIFMITVDHDDMFDGEIQWKSTERDYIAKNITVGDEIKEPNSTWSEFKEIFEDDSAEGGLSTGRKVAGMITFFGCLIIFFASDGVGIGNVFWFLCICYIIFDCILGLNIVLIVVATFAILAYIGFGGLSNKSK